MYMHMSLCQIAPCLENYGFFGVKLVNWVLEMFKDVLNFIEEQQ